MLLIISKNIIDFYHNYISKIFDCKVIDKIESKLLFVFKSYEGCY